MILCHVWIYPLSLLDSVCFISVILILLFTFTLVLQMNLNCFCHVYRRKFMNVTLTLIGCWLISFAQMDFHWMIFYTVTPPYHLFVAVAIKTLDGELIRACDQTYNTGKPRKSGIQEIVGVWFCSTLIIKQNEYILNVFVAFLVRFHQIELAALLCLRESLVGGGVQMKWSVVGKKKTNNVTECMRILGYNKFQLCAPQIARFYFTYTEPSQYVLSYISKGVSNYIDPIYLSIKQFVILTP